MPRPDLPPEAISKYTPTFQFPKTLLLPIFRSLTRMQDRGWIPAARLKQHVVICGFPRSGSTLLQLMLETSFNGIRTYGRERRALEVAVCGKRTHHAVITKRPKDVFLIPEIRDFYASHEANVRFILLCRDPRDVLTSFHFSRPGEYFVSTSAWWHIYQHWNWACRSSDVLSLRYEHLITDPDEVESSVCNFTGWQSQQRFRQFHEFVPATFDGRALNGLRPLDPDNRNRWRNDEYRNRIRTVLTELPELPRVLIDLGYETDDTWTHEYC
jgi:hypothetical protein